MKWSAIVAVLVMTFFSSPVFAQGEKPEVLLIVFGPNDPAHVKIVQNVRERLLDVPVSFLVRWVNPSPDSVDGRAAKAAQLLLWENASLVFYLEDAGAPRVQYLLRGEKDHTTLSRPLEGTGSLSVGDAMALISLTTVELLLDTGALTAPEAEPSPPPPPERTALPEPPRLLVDLGYRMNVVSPAPDIAHGGVFRISWRFFKPLRVYLGAGVFSPLTSSEGGVEVSVSEVPFSAGLLILGRKGRLSFGGGVGAVFSLLRRDFKGTDSYDMDPSSNGFQFAIDFSAIVEVAVARHFGFFAGPTLQVIPQKTEYLVEDGPVLFEEYRQIWWGFTAGVQFFAL